MAGAADPWAQYVTSPQSIAPAQAPAADPWAQYVNGGIKAPISTFGSDALDAAQSLGSGLVKGAAETAMTPETLKRAGTGLVDWGLDKAEGGVRWALGMPALSPEEQQYRAEASANAPSVVMDKTLASGQDAARGMLTDNLHAPTTLPGQYAQTIGEFVPGLAGGEGSLAARVVRQVLVPAVTSETAGQVAHQVAPGLEPYARLAGGVAGSVGGAATQPSVAAIDGLTPQAASYMANNLSSPALLPQQMADLQKLGPTATMADVSPSWMGVARAAAARPDTRDTVVNTLTDRAAGANTRLGQDLNSALGPAQVPSQVAADITSAQKALGPSYDQAFQNARAVDTRPIADNLESAATNLRGPAQSAVQQVRSYLNIPGTDVLDPHPGALFQTRSAIDGLLKTEQNPQVVRQLSIARQQVDDALAASVPGIKNIDAQWQELARQKEALAQGSTVLDTGKTALWPQEFQVQQQANAVPAGTMVGPSASALRSQQGTRAELERIVGTTANDPAALRRAIQSEGDWNRAKMAGQFGQAPAQQVFDAVDREGKFANTANRVTAGSDTAMANRFGQFLDQQSVPKTVPLSANIVGMGLGAAQKLYGALRSAGAERNAGRYANQLGEASVSSGPAQAKLLRALMDYHTANAGVSPTRDALARALLTSGAASSVARGQGG